MPSISDTFSEVKSTMKSLGSYFDSQNSDYIHKLNETMPRAIRSFKDAEDWEYWMDSSFSNLSTYKPDTQEHAWFNFFDWNSNEEDLDKRDVRGEYADYLGVDIGVFDVFWIQNRVSEPNIEDAGVDEQSEWWGPEQHLTSGPVDLVEDVEVSVSDPEEDPWGEEPELEDFDIDMPSLGAAEEPASGNNEAITTKSTLEKLRRSQISVPGLPSIDEIVENFISKVKPFQSMIKPYQDAIKVAKDEETRKKYEDDLKKQMSHLKDSIKEEFQIRLDTIKTEFKTLKEGVTSIPTVITSFSVNVAVPKVVVAGAATGVTNPATAISEFLAFKSQITALVNQLTSSAMNILNQASFMKLELPKAILAPIDGLATIMEQISSLAQPEIPDPEEAAAELEKEKQNNENIK